MLKIERIIPLEEYQFWSKLVIMLEKQQKPKFLNLFQISMPVTAIVSILHRLSGLLLVLLLPLLIYIFQISLQSELHYFELLAYFDSLLVRVVLVLFVWIVLHHVLAGIRYLLIDIDLGISLKQARRSAWIVNLAALILTLLFALDILL